MLLSVREALDAVAYLDELLGRRAPVGRGSADPRGHLLLEARHPNLEELIEVLAEDGQKLGPLQQGNAVVLSEREHPLVEVEPRQLTIEVAHLVVVLVGRGHAPDRTDARLATT